MVGSNKVITYSYVNIAVRPLVSAYWPSLQLKTARFEKFVLPSIEIIVINKLR